MKIKLAGSVLLFLLMAASPTSNAATKLETLGRKAVSENATESASATAELRSMGPAGLNSLFELNRAEVDRHIANPLAPATPEWQRLSAALDAVSQQKDSYLSGLYWYTDLAQAKAAARAAGKPILSLRLLGKLNEEYSCANSRFFRTILYSNAEVSKMLRERFILHWQSVRPAPRVTIDFGDGRKLERTLTGNSIHYILDASGQPVDALPGLYGPAAFMRSLTQMEDAARHWGEPGDGKRREPFWAYHPDSLRKITLNWLLDTEKIGGQTPQGFVVTRSENGAPQALEIASLAITKRLSEVDILRSMTAGSEALGAITDEAAWNKIALLHVADAQLDARSIGLIQRQTQKAFQAGGSKSASDETLANLVRKLEMNIALDTVRNEYLLHTKLYAWLVADRNRFDRIDLDTLNIRVYAELFMTPASDPWLGLFSPEVYTALEGGGIIGN